MCHVALGVDTCDVCALCGGRERCIAFVLLLRNTNIHCCWFVQHDWVPLRAHTLTQTLHITQAQRTSQAVRSQRVYGVGCGGARETGSCSDRVEAKQQRCCHRCHRCHCWPPDRHLVPCDVLVSLDAQSAPWPRHRDPPRIRRRAPVDLAHGHCHCHDLQLQAHGHERGLEQDQLRRSDPFDLC